MQIPQLRVDVLGLRSQASGAFLTVLQLALALIFLNLSIQFAFWFAALEPLRAILGPLATPDQLEAYRNSLGFNQSDIGQTIASVFSIFWLDFGESFYFKVSAFSIFASEVMWTLLRAISASLLGAILGVSLFLSTKKSLASVFMKWSLSINAVPGIVYILIILWILARLFGVTPASEQYIYDVALTAIASVLTTVGVLRILISNRFSNIDDESYLGFLSMLGASDRDVAMVLVRHKMPEIAVITTNGFAGALSIVTIGELVLDLPGAGALFLRACERGDLPLIHVGTAFSVTVFILSQKFAEWLTVHADTRVRTHED